LKALIFAAGLGTRLKPYTSNKPKALVEVDGKPMLEHLIQKLKQSGIREFYINIHHFGDLIIKFLKDHDNFNCTIHISDEKENLLDTGGGLKKVLDQLGDHEDLLVHNVDVFTDFDLNLLMNHHKKSKSLISLLVQNRSTSRYLLFDKEELQLQGWINEKTQEKIPSDIRIDDYKKLAFNGIHIINSRAKHLFPSNRESFPIIPVYLNLSKEHKITALELKDNYWLDLGKKEQITKAEQYIKSKADSFINDIVDSYFHTEQKEPLNSCIITPNKRAHRFIKQAIISKTQNGGFLPKIFSIDDFISEYIPLIRIDEVDLSYILYQVFNKQLPEEEELDFEEFLSFASILLHDFNEMDMQLVDGKDIFSYLNDAKAIQQWNPDGSELSPSQKEYLRFYNHLAIIYTEFKATLLKQGLCYQGMAYRYFSDHLIEIIDLLPWTSIMFAGFNALTKSEEKIIKFLHNKDMVHTVWDTDSYYVDNPIMEAGLYFRKYKSWNKDIEEQTKKHFKEGSKNIEIIGVPGILGQARIASQIMAEKVADCKNNVSPTPFENKTVMVPADESLLIPLLNSLPAKILQHANVTMGLSIQHSHAFRLAESLIGLHVHASKISSLHTKNSRFHKDDLLAVLNNRLINLLYSAPKDNKIDIEETFLSELAVNTIVHQSGLQSIEQIFQPCHNQAAELVKRIQFVFNHLILLKDKDDEDVVEPKEKDALQQILQIFNRLESLISEHKKPDNLKGLQVLYKQLITGLSQSFTGNIHQGLQIMGLLETRLMDFKNVIILSSNEDILPASSFSNSFIPADIRYEFDLPGIQEKTAVFSYHFYRLIQRAENIFLIYSSTKKAMSGGEKSRFIKQIEYELSKYKEYKNISIKHQLLNFEELDFKTNQEIIIKKNQKIIEKLELLATKGLSPTSLIAYNQCSLKFYFKYIAKIYEPDEKDGIIDERIIGNVIHKILEDFYRPFINKNFPAHKLKELKEHLPQLINDTFEKEFKGKFDEGSNYLSVKDTEYYLSKFIDYEINEAKKEKSDLIILGVEENLKRPLSINTGEKDLEVLIKGQADRIDEKNKSIRILDYKTGAITKADIKIPKDIDGEINPLFTNTKYNKALQLYVYHWMYQATSDAPAKAGIVSFRLIKEPYVMLKQDINTNLNDDFKEFVSSIFNINTTFIQTQDKDICSYCPYLHICSKN